MFIEVFHKGRFVNRAYIHLPDEDLSIPFEQRVTEREKTVKLVLEDFIANTLPAIYRDNNDVQLAVIFESKMNTEENVPVLAPPDLRKKPAVRVVRTIRFSGKEQAKHHKAEYSNPQFDYKI